MAGAYGGNDLKAEPANLKWVRPAEVFGAQVPPELGLQLETVLKRLQQENAKITQRLSEKSKENLVGRAVNMVGTLTCNSIMCYWLQSHK